MSAPRYIQSSPDPRFDLLWLKLLGPSEDEAHWAGYHPGTYLLEPGSVHQPDSMPLPVAVRLLRDEAITLRDGTVIYVDVYLPAAAPGPVPTLMSWNPSGKQGIHDRHPRGVVGDDRFFGPTAVSGLQMWLNVDPAYWTANGYAVVNADPRGVYASAGDVQYFGPQDAEDGHDAVEWIAAQQWSNGNVGMAGNAWSAIEQWFIAATKPPHLKAIAPWEGHGDFYREEFVVGGIPKPADTSMRRTYGAGRFEFTAGMAQKFPVWNNYWQSKRVDPGQIGIPTFAVASYMNTNHTRGTIDMFRGLASPEKWLLVHNEVETAFFRRGEAQAELLAFFDHFLNARDNGWEQTPRLRIAVLDHGHTDTVARPEDAFPPTRAELTRLYLAADGALTTNPQSTPGTVSYRPEPGADSVAFVLVFERVVELIGYSKLRLWMQCEGADDMDVFVSVNKLANDGTVLAANYLAQHPAHAPNPRMYSGPSGGRLRASLRALDEAASTPDIPRHTFDRPQKLSSHEIVAIDIGIPPAALRFHPGEQLQIVVSAADPNGAGSGLHAVGYAANSGTSVIHFGGQRASYLLVPLITEED